MIAPEPHLTFGDTGEWVLRLQTRLKALGLFDETVDGAFGESTKAAVTRLQEGDGLLGDGEVGEQTWAALVRAEEKAGLQDPFAHAVEGDALDPAVTPVGALSEDQQWHWDGDRWQPKDHVLLADAEPGGSHASADGHWVWDGTRWQPASGDPAGDIA
jgi:hypothetical protein